MTDHLYHGYVVRPRREPARGDRPSATAPSATAPTADALRSRLEALVLQAAFDGHYRSSPKVRPSLGDLTVAAAELDGHRLTSRPELLRRAAKEIVKSHPDADADDVLLWAEAQAAVAG